MNEKEAKESKNMVLEALSLIFPNTKVTMTPRALLLNQNDRNVIIDEGNFEYFQNILRQVFCISLDKEDYNPANKEAEAIAEKIKKAKARVAHIKGEDVGSVYARYISSLAIGLKVPLKDLLQCTIYQIRDMLERFSL
jgi:hypothetical protein